MGDTGERDAQRAFAKALLSWAQATKDEGKATRPHAQAAKELERAKQAVEPTDLDPLLSEFNDGQMLKGGAVDGRPRMYRDVKAIAVAAAEDIKSRNPDAEITVRGLDSGEVVLDRESTARRRSRSQSPRPAIRADI